MTTSTSPYYFYSPPQIPIFQSTTGAANTPTLLDSGTDNSPVSTPLQDAQFTATETQQRIFEDDGTVTQEYPFDATFNFDANTQMTDVNDPTLFNTLIGDHNNLQIMESNFNNININNTGTNTTVPLDLPFVTFEQ